MSKQIFFVRVEREDSGEFSCDIVDEVTVKACKTQTTMADDRFIIRFGSNSSIVDKFDAFYAGLAIGKLLGSQS